MSSLSRKVSQSGFRCAVNSTASVVPGSILAVVVLYNRSFRDVPCARSLEQWLAAPGMVSNHLWIAHCLIYDNSPVAQPVNFDRHERMDLFHDVSNGGTRAAYLHALKIAKEEGYQWILFLDHDTDLPQDFLLSAEQALRAVPQLNLGVCAVVPLVFDGQNSISPSAITAYGRVHPLTDESNNAKGRTALTAISSAAIVNVDSLEGVLPIPTEFSLDYLDHWLFRAMQNGGGHVVISSSRVAHSLSVQAMRSINIHRYRSVLTTELLFLRNAPDYSAALHFSWLLLRTLKLMLTTRRLDLMGACTAAAFNVIRKKYTHD